MEKFTEKLKREEEAKHESSATSKPKPSYLARVVLHRIDDDEDYSDLHEAMEKRGFVPTVNGSHSLSKSIQVTHALPPGMYYSDSNLPSNSSKAYPTLNTAFSAVKAAVAEVMRDEKKYVQDANTPPTIFVTETTDSKWSGLKKAPKTNLE